MRRGGLSADEPRREINHALSEDAVKCAEVLQKYIEYWRRRGTRKDVCRAYINHNKFSIDPLIGHRLSKL